MTDERTRRLRELEAIAQEIEAASLYLDKPNYPIKPLCSDDLREWAKRLRAAVLDTEGDRPAPTIEEADLYKLAAKVAHQQETCPSARTSGPCKSCVNRVDFARLCILRLRLRADTEGDASPAPSICPSYICPVCYHEKDRCSHCDTALPDPPVQP